MKSSFIVQTCLYVVVCVLLQVSLSNAAPVESVVVGQWSKTSMKGETVAIKGGEFMMGDTSAEGSECERPLHKVQLSGFEMTTREVTRAQFASFLTMINAPAPGTSAAVVVNGVKYADLATSGLKHTGNKYIAADGETLPAIVTWYGADAYCRSMGGRLPTEAEWEYGARAGATTRYPWGDRFDEALANGRATGDESKTKEVPSAVDQNGKEVRVHASRADKSTVPPGSLKPVGSYKPNAWGLYDMIGNAKEWCQDWFGVDYYSFSQSNFPAGVQDPKGPDTPSAVIEGGKGTGGHSTARLPRDAKVVRGGSHDSDEIQLRCASRGHAGQDQCAAGFRVAFPTEATATH